MKHILFAIVFLGAALPAQAKESADIERGRYLIKTTGCNDCHTPAFGPRDGNVPESEWLIGDQLGWKGPWGTTYPTNLRARVQTMTEEEFVTYAKTLKARPPMPWYNLNAMKTADLQSVYRFIKSLGPSKNPIPEALPPGQQPKGPFMDLTVVVPKK